MLRVNETFYSIEGEGPFIGIPTFFIRLTGCNLRCAWTPIGETRILMVDHSWKQAKRIKEGDVVVGFTAGKVKNSKVVNVVKTRSPVVKLTFESGKDLTVTPEHPFYCIGNRVTRADRSLGKSIRTIGKFSTTKKEDGTLCLDLQGTPDKVVKIEIAGSANINHFETETHNYISEGYLSHNCDTTYSFSGGEPRTVDSLLEEVFTYGTKQVCITGGEPLLQKEVYSLMYKLLDSDFKIILETGGSIPVDDVPTEDNMIIAMDIKTPSSKMVEHNIYANIGLLGAKDYVKFVIADDEDFQFSKDIMKEYPFEGEYILQPQGGKNLRELTEKVLKERLNIRVLPQLHKFVWGETRGK